MNIRLTAPFQKSAPIRPGPPGPDGHGKDFRHITLEIGNAGIQLAYGDFQRCPPVVPPLI